MNAIAGKPKPLPELSSRRGRRPGKPQNAPGRPVDVHVGSRVRLRRTLLGMSQEKLGEAIGLTFQQVQKYERGANRIGASRLFDLSQVLDVPVGFFFDDLPAEVLDQPVGCIGDDVELRESPDDVLAKRETLEIMRAYYRINDPDLRKRIADLIKTAAKLAGAGPEEGEDGNA